MMYDTILARSFSKHDQKKLGFGAFLGCLIIALTICFVFKPYLDPTKILTLQAPMDAGLKMLSNPFLPKSSSPNQSSNISNDGEKRITNRKSIPNQEKSIPNQDAIIPSEEKGIPNQESIPNEEKSKPSQEISISNEEKSNTNEEMNIANEEKSTPNQETGIANEEKSNTIEEKTIPNQETSIANEERSNPNEEKNIPNQETSINANEEKSNANEERSIPNERNQERNPHQKDIQTKEFKPICNFSLPRSDICQMSGDIRVHSKSSTILVPSTTNTSTNSPRNSTTTSWTIRPYARKEDTTAMENVRNFTVKMVTKPSHSQSSSPEERIPSCTHNHNVTGILFSTAGYVGNHFHEFTDVVIPLYLTSREFNGQVQFLVTNKNTYWISKYKAVLDRLSKYEIIDIDSEKEEEKVHCFPSMFVGLKQHKELSIDPSRSPHSMTDFRKFMREAYSLKRQTAWRSSARTIKQIKKQPCLLIVARRRTRRFTNEGEIENMARRVGFRVVVTEGDSNLARFSRIVNSCDVMMGVHGAGLTNIVFLPENAVLIQVVPLGGSNWLARTYFGEPAKEMKLKYLEYKIGEEESSLREQYPPDHPVFRNPISVSKRGWLAFKAVYLDKQNVKLDVERFKPTLVEALKLLRDQ